MMQWQQANYVISTDKSRLQIDIIHDFLRQSYWSPGRPLATLRTAIEHSLCFGVYEDRVQIGFARVISDEATFAYLADVFIVESHRGQGLSKWLMSCIQQHPQLQGLRRWLLATADAHGLYHQFGFTPLTKPERFLEINRPNIYLENTAEPR